MEDMQNRGALATSSIPVLPNHAMAPTTDRPLEREFQEASEWSFKTMLQA